MRTRHGIALALALALVVLAPRAAAPQETAEADLLDAIVRDGPHARAIRAATDVVVFEQAARLTLPNPAASYRREGAGFTEFFEIEQRLPAFGVRAALRRAGVAARASAEAERDARLWALRMDARAAIARMQFEATRLAAAEAMVSLVERLIAVLRTRESEGEGSRFDRVRAEQELAEGRQSVTAAAIAMSDARSTVSALLPTGVVIPSTLAARARAEAVAPIDSLFARAAERRAELRALRNLGTRFEIEAEISRQFLRPAPFLIGGVKRADDSGDRTVGAVLGLTVNVPLFNTGKSDAARWNAERLRVDAERSAVESDIRSQIVRASTALAIRQQTRAALAAGSSSANELVTIADVAYREGDIGILELLDAYRTTSRAGQRAVQFDLELRLAEIALERAVGEALWP